MTERKTGRLVARAKGAAVGSAEPSNAANAHHARARYSAGDSMVAQAFRTDLDACPPRAAGRLAGRCDQIQELLDAGDFRAVVRVAADVVASELMKLHKYDPDNANDLRRDVALQMLQTAIRVAATRPRSTRKDETA